MPCCPEFLLFILFSSVLARLMDAGKNLYGVVRHKEIDGYYHRIAIKVYMKD